MFGDFYIFANVFFPYTHVIIGTPMFVEAIISLRQQSFLRE